MDRPLTDRERSVLDALLAVELEDAAKWREQASIARAVHVCSCGCPSVDFVEIRGKAVRVLVSAAVSGTRDSLFLFAIGDQLGGIEYVSNSAEMAHGLPDPASLAIY